MLVTVLISSDEGRTEKRKLLLFTEQYLELGIRKGSVLDEVAFDKLEELSKKCVAVRKGADLLSYSASSKNRLAQRLRAKGIDKESATSAAEHLKKIGLIDEEVDVERQVSSCLKKLWGRRRIYRELCAKGYDRSIVEAEVSKLDEKLMVENCVALLAKKHKTIPDEPNERKKIVASLLRYGYTFSQIKTAFKLIEK